MLSEDTSRLVHHLTYNVCSRLNAPTRVQKLPSRRRGPEQNQWRIEHTSINTTGDIWARRRLWPMRQRSLEIAL